jgi:hypothetical protein
MDDMRIRTAIRLMTHPLALWLIVAVSVVLWMPFGMGYYGWPWEQIFYRVLIQVVAFSFVVLSGVGLFLAFRAERKAFRVVTGIIALLVTVFGVLALYGWKDDYLDFIRLRDEQNHVHQSDAANGR